MSDKRLFQPWLHGFAVFLSAATLILLCAGALVTSTGSGLAVPDWPLSYGQYFPAMVGGVLFEHGHRMIAGTVGLICFAFTITVWVTQKSWPALRWVSLAAALAVILQATLGGLTVLLRLPPAVSVGHACLGQIFFCLTVVMALMTGKGWTAGYAPLKNPGTFLPKFALIVTAGFFVQLLMGAVMRHIGAGLAIADFPLVDGGAWPVNVTPAKAIHFAHRVGAFTMVALVIALVAYIGRKFSDHLRLVGISGLLVMFVMIQILLGALVIWTRKPVSVTTVHLAVGALCLACSVALTVTAFRSSRLGEAT